MRDYVIHYRLRDGTIGEQVLRFLHEPTNEDIRSHMARQGVGPNEIMVVSFWPAETPTVEPPRRLDVTERLALLRLLPTPLSQGKISLRTFLRRKVFPSVIMVYVLMVSFSLDAMPTALLEGTELKTVEHPIAACVDYAAADNDLGLIDPHLPVKFAGCLIGLVKDQ